jgi:hypothetical protein
VSARLEHQRAPEMVGVLQQPRALLEHRSPARRRKTVHDEAQRFSGRVRVDCFHTHHAIKL